MRKKLYQVFSKDKALFVLVFSLAFIGIIARFIWLGRFPPGINHDEVDLILSSQTIWKYGRDVSGIKFPSSLFYTGVEAKQAGLPAFLLSPYFGNIKITLLSARIPMVLVNLITIFFLAWIVWILTKNVPLLLLTVFVGIFNPWLFFYSRTPTEAPFSLMFTLMGVSVLLKAKRSKILYSILFFVFSFFAYFGAKPIILLFTPLVLPFVRRKFDKDVSLSLSLKYLFLFFLIIAGYFYISFNMTKNTFSNRSNELVFSNLNTYGAVVDESRKVSITTPLTNIFF